MVVLSGVGADVILGCLGILPGLALGDVLPSSKTDQALEFRRGFALASWAMIGVVAIEIIVSVGMQRPDRSNADSSRGWQSQAAKQQAATGSLR